MRISRVLAIDSGSSYLRAVCSILFIGACRQQPLSLMGAAAVLELIRQPLPLATPAHRNAPGTPVRRGSVGVSGDASKGVARSITRGSVSEKWEWMAAYGNFQHGYCKSAGEDRGERCH